jgi:polygalacturonase
MKSIKSFFILLIYFPIILFPQTQILAEDWEDVSSILEKIVRPIFPDYEVSITDFGAVGNGINDCSDAFKNAIDYCTSKGGGTVIVPEGIYLTGTIYLKSNINLHLNKNSVVKFSTDPKKYLPVVYTRWEGVECINYSSLIHSLGEENIAVTGDGVLDGQGSNNNWWSWKGNTESGWREGLPQQNSDRDKLFSMAENNVPVEERIFGEGHYLRPNFFQSYKCKNILIEGVTFKDSPMWCIHPVLCENVSIINVKIEGFGPNNDGCDPESSKNVLIDGCNFNNGDDCIAIKSGRNNDGRRVNVPGENIIIRNCQMNDGHGGIVIGSEISGGAKNIFVEDCIMSSPNLERAIRIKTNAVRGGVIENVFVRNIRIGELKEAVLKINFFYEEGEKGNFLPVVRNIRLQNITSEKSKYAVWIKAFDKSPATDIELKDCLFNNVTEENVIENVSNLKTESVMINGKPWDFKNSCN